MLNLADWFSLNTTGLSENIFDVESPQSEADGICSWLLTWVFKMTTITKKIKNKNKIDKPTNKQIHKWQINGH